MSVHGEEILKRLTSDQAFRRMFYEDRARTLALLELSDDDLAVLEALDLEAIATSAGAVRQGARFEGPRTGIMDPQPPGPVPDR